MPAIMFIQYVRPDGRKWPAEIDRPDDVAAKAQAILDAGFWFECEALTTGEVSLTITDDEADHAIELCPNGPAVPDAVDRLILGFEIPKRN